jgi:hypothetical protein
MSPLPWIVSRKQCRKNVAKRNNNNNNKRESNQIDDDDDRNLNPKKMFYYGKNLRVVKKRQLVRQKKCLWNSLQFKAKEIKKILPNIQDINIIDKYSRLLFPILFLVFNLFYWCFYFIQNTYLLRTKNNLHL